jgi:hypothetical protein
MKKYDKVLGESMKAPTMAAIENDYFWKRNAESESGALNQEIDKVVHL